MRKKITLWVCTLCMLGLSGALQAQNRFLPERSQLDEVNKAVKASRDSWLNMFPANELPDYGFRDQREKSSSVPGKPIEVFAMYRDSDGKIKSQPTGEFLVPLLIDGKSRTFLTVAYFENKWQVVAVGEMNLAQEAAPFISRAGKEGSDNLIWLKNINHAADFIASAGTALSDDQLQFMPLSTAQRASFKEPLSYRQLEARVNKMLVQFD